MLIELTNAATGTCVLLNPHHITWVSVEVEPTAAKRRATPNLRIKIVDRPEVARFLPVDPHGAVDTHEADPAKILRHFQAYATSLAQRRLGA